MPLFSYIRLIDASPLTVLLLYSSLRRECLLTQVIPHITNASCPFFAHIHGFGLPTISGIYPFQACSKTEDHITLPTVRVCSLFLTSRLSSYDRNARGQSIKNASKPASWIIARFFSSTHFQDTVFSSLTSYWQATCSINLPFCLFRSQFCSRPAVSVSLSSCIASKTKMVHRRRRHFAILSRADRLGFGSGQHLVPTETPPRG